MYLRTTTRRNQDGSEVRYLYLAHNHRDPETGQSRASLIHNFGREDELDVEGLKRLCRAIARTCGLEVVEPGRKASSGKARRSVLVPGVTRVKTRPFGLVLLCGLLWEELGVGPELRRVLAEQGLPEAYERALFAMVANRLDEPESKLGVWERWLGRQHLPSCRGLQRNQLYEALDVLHEHRTRLEEAVFFQTADLLNLQVDVVFYDTTTCSFSVDEEDEEGPRRFGRAKEGGWTVQVVVALAVTREGIPVRSWVFPGKTSDVTTVEQVKADLRGWKLGRALFVADAGMNSEDNREVLAQACGHYLLATRAGGVKEVHETVLSRAGRYRKIAENLHAKDVTVGSGTQARRYIVCFNPQEAERQKAHRARVLTEIEAKLAEHPDHDATAKWAIELLASKRWGRYLRVDRRGQIAPNPEAAAKAERLDGKWVLQTNDDTLTTEDAATGYKSLLVIERCFRTLKTAQIRMSPVYHRLSERIEAHVKVCVLALLLERVAELRARSPWPSIAETLDGLQATEYRTESHRFFERNELTPELRRLLKKLAIPEPNDVLSVEPIPPKA